MLNCKVLSEIRIKTNNDIKIIPAGKIFITSDIESAYSLAKSSKIKILSTNINDLSVKQSPQSLQSPQIQCDQGLLDTDIEKSMSAMSACNDYTAARSCKNPTSARNTQPWSSEMQELIAWFETASCPEEPFYLQPHMRVMDPAKFFESLWREIDAGPRGVRARMGTLQSDLRALRAKLIMKEQHERDITEIGGKLENATNH